jgi:hypothetical protein
MRCTNQLIGIMTAHVRVTGILLRNARIHWEFATLSLATSWRFALERILVKVLLLYVQTLPIEA